MNLGYLIRRTTSRSDDTSELSEGEAHELCSAILDGGIPDLELGALLTAIALNEESPAELLGYNRAVAQRLNTLRAPVARPRPLVIPTYGGTRTEHNLLPLLGLLLRRLGVPVLFHGTLEANGRVASAYILRELGVLPSATILHAQAALDEDLMAFVPVAALSPALATLLGLRHRLGIENIAHSVVQLIDPFEEQAVRLASADTTAGLDKLASVLSASGTSDLLLNGTEGEPFADPRQRPQIEWVSPSERTVLFTAEPNPMKAPTGLPSSNDAHATAGWIRQALAGTTPIPHPLVNELACCLYATGYTDDMNQAKAIAAVETGSLGSVGRRESHRAMLTDRPV